MEDRKIIDLYWSRSEEAIRETERSYGQKLYSLAHRILQNHQDSEESVSDTYLTAWNTIPPQYPTHFFAYLAKVCRSFALGKLDWKNAVKRSAEIVALTKEMEQCIPDQRQEQLWEGRALGQVLNAFLATLSHDNRLIFLRRYWYADSIAEISTRYGMSESKVKTQLHRTRKKLQSYLEREGISL